MAAHNIAQHVQNMHNSNAACDIKYVCVLYIYA